jgi:hypothetical protein
MATIGASLPTLLDEAKRTDPQGNIVSIVELLTRRNPMLEDMVFQEGNLTTGHRVSSRTGLPSLGWRRFNEGVSPSKSLVDNFDEACGMLEGMSVVDEALADLNGNAAAYRATEDAAFLQAFNNEVSTGIFYHSTKTAPEKFMGLAPRLDATSGTIAASQVLLCEPYATVAGNDQTSLFFVTWSPDSVFGIYPRGGTAGLQQQDLGKQLWDDLSGDSGSGYQGKKFTAWVTKWTWKIGLVVKDYRQVVRLCNIDASRITGASLTADTFVGKLIDAYYQLNDPGAGRTAIYCNRAIGAFLHKVAMSKSSSQITIETFAGRPVTTLLGIPIRITDAITSTEAPVQ